MPRKPDNSLVPLIWAAGALFGGVLLHIDRVPLWASGVAILCIAWRFAAVARSVPLPGRAGKSIVVLLLLGACFVQFRTLNGLQAGSALLVAMGSIKLLETHNQRDRYIVIGAAFFLLLAACLDRQTLWRAPLYLAQAWLCCSALAVASRGSIGMTNRATATLAAKSLVLAVPIAVVFFLFFPRMTGAFWSLPPSDAASTGLSDSMSPGSISSLGENDAPAFRVHFESELPPPEERYWRGPVLHEFDGYTWTQAPGQAYMRQDVEYLGPEYRYRVTMEPSSQNWWFALDTVTGSPDPRRVRLTFDHQLVARRPVTNTISYSAVSYTRTRTTSPLPLVARRVDTRLPADRNLRSVSLAKQMRSEAASDEEYIEAVLDLFRRGGFEYTLTPPLLNLDSVDDFLFNTKLGFCGHYASAFVTLMRAAGVPSRVVTGYHGGEWNPIRQYLLVRQSHAHAWAEVWLEGRGWTRVDPTSVVAPERLRRGLYDVVPDAAPVSSRMIREVPWLADLSQRWDAANDWWNERVVRFNMQTQMDLLGWLGFESPNLRILGWLLAAGLIGWLLVLTWHIARSARRPMPDRLARAYQRLCDKLARAGARREPHEGPMAFANRVAERRPDLASTVEPLLAKYAELRFGSEVPESARADAVRAFERAVARFRAPRLTTS